ncbi:MAG TPA: hypothetical protein PL195_03435 [bacterium]|nr:hypothetical protein [bacterium]
MGKALKKFLVFAILFAGTIEAAAPVDKSSDDKITVSGIFNTFTVSTCSTTDKYVQGAVRVSHDKRVDKNWETHISGTYARSKRIEHEYDPGDSDDPDEAPLFQDSGRGSIGISFWWDYLRIRGDLSILAWNEHYQFEKDRAVVMPMGGGLIEAGKMDFLWISTGSLYSEYPYGFLQVALNGKIKKKSIFGGGLVWIPVNITTWQPQHDAQFSLFLHTRAEFNDLLALKGYVNFKPLDPKLMFEFSLGLEFSF